MNLYAYFYPGLKLFAFSSAEVLKWWSFLAPWFIVSCSSSTKEGMLLQIVERLQLTVTSLRENITLKTYCIDQAIQLTWGFRIRGNDQTVLYHKANNLSFWRRRKIRPRSNCIWKSVSYNVFRMKVYSNSAGELSTA